MGWGQPHRAKGTDMGDAERADEDSPNRKNRRIQELEGEAKRLAEENTERHHALPPQHRPTAAASLPVKVETLIALWCDDDPEREARFAVEYQRQLGLAYGDLEARAAMEAGPRLVKPAGGGLVVPRKPG